MQDKTTITVPGSSKVTIKSPNGRTMTFKADVTIEHVPYHLGPGINTFARFTRVTAECQGAITLTQEAELTEHYDCFAVSITVLPLYAVNGLELTKPTQRARVWQGTELLLDIKLNEENVRAAMLKVQGLYDSLFGKKGTDVAQNQTTKS
jgi:hypothetical protein